MIYETFHEVLEQTTDRVFQFWTKLKLGDINVYSFHKVGIAVAQSLKELRTTMNRALE